MDRFQELMEKWERKTWDLHDRRKFDAEKEVNNCIDDLKDTLLLIEADQVLNKPLIR